MESGCSMLHSQGLSSSQVSRICVIFLNKCAFAGLLTSRNPKLEGVEKTLQ